MPTTQDAPLRRLIVVPSQADWPQQYAREAQLLRPVFADHLRDILHVGSTAVPGMVAKPTIDILCVVDQSCDISGWYPHLRILGFTPLGECLDRPFGTPGRHFLPRIIDHQHVTHLHICHQGHHQIREMIALRDYLRSHPTRAQAYGAHKSQLAATVDHQAEAYLAGKAPLVSTLISEALHWADQHAHG